MELTKTEKECLHEKLMIYVETFKHLPKGVSPEVYCYANAYGNKRAITHIPDLIENWSEEDLNEFKRIILGVSLEMAYSALVQFAYKGIMLVDNTEYLTYRPSSFAKAAVHVLAERGFKFEDKNILLAKTRDGETVAHILARKGEVFDDPEILNAKSDKGTTVRGVMIKAKGLAKRSIFL